MVHLLAGKKGPFQIPRSVILAAVIATAVYIGHISVLGPWIVDDAGISFSYARNLAQGQGLVAQPGAAPVEGFTNLLWVLILSIPMKLHMFDPVITPKLISAVFVALSFIFTGYLMYASSIRPAWLIALALSFSAGLTGFAVWTASGLENALYALAVSILAAISIRLLSSEGRRSLFPIAAGIVLFFVFCTRPDGALYFWIPPFLLGAGAELRHKHRPLVAYIVAFVGPWILLTLFRIMYFHDVLPNTFYAKRGEGSMFFAWLFTNLPRDLAGLIVMLLGGIAIPAIAFAIYSLGRKVRQLVSPSSLKRHIACLYFGTSLFVYYALRGDWMPEYRYATPAFLFGPVTVLAILWDIFPGLRSRRAPKVAVIVALLAMVGAYSFRHTSKFVNSPTIPFSGVREMTLRIAEAIKPLGPDVAVLTPDIGGALWENRYRVIDLVGLVDRALGQTVSRNPQSLRDYLLKERKPEGVWLHSFWLASTGFDRDPLFAELYAPVWEDRPSLESPPTAGFYLRRDLVRIGPDGLARPHTSLKAT